MLILRADTDGRRREASYGALPDLVAAVEALGEEDGWAGDLTFRVSLAVDEIAQNVLDHAYGGGRGDLEVAISSLDDAIVVEIVDGGRPFDPLTDAPDPDLTSAIEDRPVGGLGVHFARSLMDDIEYRRDSERNCLKLVARKVR